MQLGLFVPKSPVEKVQEALQDIPGQWRLESNDEWGTWFEGYDGANLYTAIMKTGWWQMIDHNIGDVSIEGEQRPTANSAWAALKEEVDHIPNAGKMLTRSVSAQ